ncbi:MAG: helix-turn-helix transcriptional regulator [Alphaproteobacteria bacterium]|nr:helix-turn-helix transcriptional regulator [Alphaproteobacteria bacterium]
MTEVDRISRSTLALYDAAMGRARWSDALEQILHLTGMEGAAMIVFDTRTVSIHDWCFRRIDRRDADDEPSAVAGLDDRNPDIAELPDTRLTYDRLHAPQRTIDRPDHHDWHRRTAGLRYYVGGVTTADEAISASLSLHRGRAGGHVRREEVELFQHVFDHFERAVRIGHKLAMAERWTPGWEAMFAGTPIGIAFLADDGRLLRCNDALRCIADAADGLVLEPAGLRALRRSDDAPLQAAIMAALPGGDDAASGGTARIARRSGRAAYSVLTAPLPRADAPFGIVAPVAVVFVTDPDSGADLPQDRLRDLYGLTPAELRLAVRLVSGESISEIAGQLGLSVATLRSQLASLFRKTGTSRQSELMRLLLCVPWQVGAR